MEDTTTAYLSAYMYIEPEMIKDYNLYSVNGILFAVTRPGYTFQYICTYIHTPHATVPLHSFIQFTVAIWRISRWNVRAQLDHAI